MTNRVPLEHGFDAVYGLELESDSTEPSDIVRRRVRVVPEVLTRAGGVSLGVLASIAEALASRGTALAVLPQGKRALGMSNDTSVVHVIDGGTVHSEARVLASDGDTWLWAIEHRNDEGQVCAFSRVTVAVRSPSGA
jgi:acyl-coenzyme A thioesterase PaaI-like protein